VLIGQKGTRKGAHIPKPSREKVLRRHYMPVKKKAVKKAAPKKKATKK
jgi:hypothetical protein